MRTWTSDDAEEGLVRLHCNGDFSGRAIVTCEVLGRTFEVRFPACVLREVIKEAVASEIADGAAKGGA